MHDKTTTNAAQPTVREARLDEPAARPLLDSLRSHYAEMYGDMVDGEIDAYDASPFEPPGGLFVLLTDEGETHAGGGFIRLDEGVAEIKRMWTSPAHRGRGHARAVLAQLERRAADAGYDIMRLQTADLQHAAIRLYRAAGYRRIAPFGRYRDEPRALGFEKRLTVAHP